MPIQNKHELIQTLREGKEIEFLFFSNIRTTFGQVTKTCLSEFYVASFKYNGMVYPTAEHFMMAEKARLFCYPEIAQQILQTTDPKYAKKLGRVIPHFNEKIWQRSRFDIVAEGNMLKFSQNPKLSDFLLGTGGSILVEASQYDSIWGMGASERSLVATKPEKWHGESLLEFALMLARERFRHMSEVKRSFVRGIKYRFKASEAAWLSKLK